MWILLAFLLAFALLVSNAAAGLACRLARGLALAASTVLCALAKALGFNSLDVLHNYSLQISISTKRLYHNSILLSIQVLKKQPKFFKNAEKNYKVTKKGSHIVKKKKILKIY